MCAAETPQGGGGAAGSDRERRRAPGGPRRAGGEEASTHHILHGSLHIVTQSASARCPPLQLGAALTLLLEAALCPKHLPDNARDLRGG